METLEQAWNRLTAPFRCRMGREAYLEGIVNRYLEPHRRYHTLAHLRRMLEIVAEHRSMLREPEAVELAVWFHDVVYDPRAGDNEERSAALARRTMSRLDVPSRIANRAIELILATRDHVPPDDTPDAALFLDADLAILGAEPAEYDRYAAAIRAEYAWLADKEYRPGRAAILRELLGRERIYLTDVLRDELEEQARENIARELAVLQE